MQSYASYAKRDGNTYDSLSAPSHADGRERPVRNRADRVAARARSETPGGLCVAAQAFCSPAYEFPLSHRRNERPPRGLLLGVKERNYGRPHPHHPDGDPGLPGAANRKCTVRAMAEIITLWPRQAGSYNSWRIKAQTGAYFVGFLATL